MKRLGYLLFSVSVLLFSVSCASLSKAKVFDLNAQGYAEAPKGTVKIDGVVDSIWNKAPLIIPQVVKGGDPGNVSGAFRILWDTDFIYVLADVQDKDLFAERPNQPWEEDSIEFFIEESNKKADRYGQYDAQYRININNVVTGGGPGYKKENVTSAVNKTKDGYIVEFKVPFQEIVPQPGVVIGFEVQINISDNTEKKRTGILGHADKENKAWSKPSLFGNLKLIK